MKQKSAFINLSIVFALLVGAGFKCAENGSNIAAPTKTEIKATLTKRQRAISLTDTSRTYYKVADVKLDFDDSSIKVGSPVEKQVGFGESGKQTYPVKVNYTITTTYTDGREPKTEEVGEGIVEYFYKNGQGEWNARYGSDY